MAYPPRKQIGPALNDTAPEIGAFMAEGIPAPSIFVNKCNIVHFDLDPQNIFLFDSDYSHRGIPVFKVSFYFRSIDFLLRREGGGGVLTPLGGSDSAPSPGDRRIVSSTGVKWTHTFMADQ